MDADPQLQLFDMPPQASAPRQPAPIGLLQLRYDHAVLLTIAGLIGVSVVFAFGVERGKQLAKAERPPMLPSSLASGLEAPRQGVETLISPQAPMTDRVMGNSESKSLRTPNSDIAPANTGSEAPVTKPVTPKAPKAVAARSGFAIQIVTYSKPKLAQRELERLKGQGESAFLMVRKDKHVTLCVGPFPSRENAAAKLADLKQQYQDCFLRSL